MAGESANPVRRTIAPVLRRLVKGGDAGVRRLPLGPGRGLRMELHPTSPLDMYLGLYEYELARHIERLCAPETICFDVGGFDGYYALVFTRLTGATVVVFDSEPESCARVQRNCALNPELGARVDVRQAYVAFETNPAENAVALDDLLARGEIPVPGLIKMDVDRAELSALTGAKALLAEHRPHLIVEVHSVELEHQCAELLLELGYRPLIVTERRWLRENRPIEHNRWIVAERA